MADTAPANARRGLFGQLSAADLVLTGGLSVIIGILFTFWAAVVYPFATVFLGQIGASFFYGVWFLGGIIPAYIIRKPGVAFLGEFIAAHVELLTGSPYGPLLTYYGASQGLACELVFAAVRYRRWDLKTLMLAGAAPALPAFALDYYLYGYANLAVGLQVALGIAILISGAVLGGALGKFLADVVARTGVVSTFPLGKEMRQRERESIGVETAQGDI